MGKLNQWQGQQEAGMVALTGAEMNCCRRPPSEGQVWADYLRPFRSTLDGGRRDEI